MSRIARLALVPALMLASAAQAQSMGFQDPAYVQPAQPMMGGVVQGNTSYETARIISVMPVLGGYASAPQQRCYTRDGYADGGNGYYGNNGYGNNSYGNNGYGNDPYRRDGGYGRNDGYYGNNGYGAPPQNSGTGRTMAGVVGSVLGAVIGSQMGNGAGRYIGTAIGSAVGGVAGQGVYDSAQRQRQPQRPASVTVCDPEPVGGYATNDARWYDVTYAYGGRTYTSRMPYRPTGDSIRVRVDVQPQQ